MASNQLTTDHFITPVLEYMPLVEERMLSITDRHHPELSAALNHLLSSGGKRIRPAIVLLTGKMLGGNLEKLVTLAAAIEMLHTATLVHDDLIDGALLRRGISTLNARWSPAATVLTGDYIFARAARLAAESESVAVMQLFADTLATIVNGEITQMFSGRGNTLRESYYERIYAKTASLFEVSTAAAAMLSPVDEYMIKTARGFGYETGMAFQIVDDILDLTGEETQVGKPVGSDLRQGLITLPALIYLENHPEDQDLIDVIASKNPKVEVVDRLVAAIRQSEAIELAHEEALLFVNRAVRFIECMPDCVERQALLDLVWYTVQRHN